MIDLSYTNKDGLNPAKGFIEIFNYHKDGKQDGEGYEHGGYPEITGETSEYTDISYMTGQDPDFFHNGNVWEQPSVVSAELVSIEITTAPAKTEYNEGDVLDLTGMVVTGTYDDGSEKVISGYTASPANGAVLTDESEVVITYKDKTAVQPITVIPAVELESIAVTTPPAKVSYFEGDTLDLTGLVVTGYYSDGSEEVVDAAASPADGSVLAFGTTEVVLSYEGKTTTQAITVSAVELESIEITTPPAKVEYDEGDNLDLTGMVVTAIYNNGHTEEVSEYTTVPADGAELTDESQVVVSYEGKDAIQAITVIPAAELVSIEITTAPSKLDYYEGDVLDLTGMVVTGTYDDGSERVIVNYTTTPDVTEPLTLGTTEFTVSYEGKTTTQAISVVAVELESIEITAAPTKVSYFDGEVLDLDGMIVTATYNNGHTEVVNDYTTSPEAGTELHVGTTEVVLSYEGKTTTQAISVVAVELESIEITAAPMKVEYFAGDALDLTGLEVTAVYNNGHTEVVSDYTTDPANGAVLTDESEVVITYEGKTVVQEIIVIAVELVNIEVATPPTKTIYEPGETLDLAGMVIQANYNNGDTEIVPSTDYVTDPAEGTTLEQGQNNVTISYEGKTVVQKIVVGGTLEGIEFTHLPDKTIYYVGEPLDLSGMAVRANYNNGTSRIVTDLCTSTPAEGTPITIEYDRDLIYIHYTEDGVTYDLSFDIIVFE